MTLRGIVAALSVAAACSGDGGTPARPEDQGTPSSTTVQAAPAYEPLYAEAPCAGGVPDDVHVECGLLTVPEDRTRPTGHTVRLPVAIIRSDEPVPAEDPIVYFSGGPGYSGLAEVASFLAADIGGPRDVILFDQRGTGSAEPSLDCPEIHEAIAAALATAGTSDDESPLLEAALADCRGRLVEGGVDVDAYDTVATAADAVDLASALGIESWNLFGVSYGTTVALEVLRQDGSRVRSAVLDSVYPPTVAGGLSSIADNYERALGVLVDGCAAAPLCAESFPGLAGDIDTVLDSLNATPHRGQITNPTLDREQEIAVTGNDVVAGLFTALYDEDLIPLLPTVINALATGGGGVFIDQLAIEGISFLNAAAEGQTASVNCSDRANLRDPEQEESVLRAHPEYGTLALFAEACDVWDVSPADPSFNEPVRSDVPALILAGEYDPVTPPDDGRAAADDLTNSTFVLFPGLGHGEVFAHDCPLAIFRAFVADPAVPVDTSCVASMPPPAWVVPGP